MFRFGSIALLLVVGIFGFAAAQKEFGFDNRKGSGQPYLKPEESVARMKVADGFEVKLFAAEPQLVNPIAMTVDEKGRVWVVECFEYPKRTAKGKMPRDRIKILEDTDGDGICDKVTIFAEGKDFPKPFDLASGIEVGNGGVYIGAPPYLWFLKDTDGDGKADKFEILLSGFGSQDTHETLNTFQWGPDGKLYGLHGVFTYSEVKPQQADGPGTRINAAVWNFDPRTRQFASFAEGTSNPWGMDYRNSDGQYILCCCVIPHLFHMSPGGIYKRQAGNSSNPYAYSYLNEICDHTFHKESGWAHAGLVSLDTPLMPEKYRDSVIFGSIHGCSIKQNKLKANGSTYTASRENDFLVSGDKNFRPINLRWGPNGEIYCIDWHDQNPCHQTNPDDWDYERGRVYRIQPKGLKTAKATDLGAKKETELATLAKSDPNPYVRRTALRLLGERSTNPVPLKEPVKFASVADVFTANAMSPFHKLTADNALKLLGAVKESAPEIRGWVIRFLLEGEQVPAELLKRLAVLAAEEPSAVVRRDLASGALKHARSAGAGELIRALLTHKEDAKDPLIPQLNWLAFESRLVASLKSELDWLKENAVGNALIAETIVPRTMRRLVATGKTEDLEAALAFVRDVSDTTVRRQALEGLVAALQNRLVDAPANWQAVRAELAKSSDKSTFELATKLAVNFRDREAMTRAMAILGDAAKPTSEKIDAIRALGLGRPAEAFAPLRNLARNTAAAAELRTEAIRALGGFDQPNLANDLLADWTKQSPAIRNEIVSVLAGRKEWARDLLNAVGGKSVPRTDLTDNTILRMQNFNDKQLNDLVEKVWGKVRNTPDDLAKLIARMRGEVNGGRASFARGKLVFEAQCAKCHKFDGKGFEVGPNIEGAGRDVEYLLTNILDPNRVIGAPYFLRTVILDNGQSHAGVLVAEDDQTITLKMENAVQKVIAKKDIDKIRVQEKSLMPEGLANNMSVQDFRDLVRYLMAAPFATDVAIGVAVDGQIRRSTPQVPPSGRIALPAIDKDAEASLTTRVVAPADMKVRLLVGIRPDAELKLGSAKFAIKGSEKLLPDQVAIDVELKKGTNELTLKFKYRGKEEAVFLRFADPDRKLSYPDDLAK